MIMEVLPTPLNIGRLIFKSGMAIPPITGKSCELN
jgi:hypothetical protein